MTHEDVIAPVERYYTDRVRTHGTTPRGVDWNGEESQILRFEELLRLVPVGEGPASLLDFGCGYGALLDTIRARGLDVDYVGYDISTDMIASAVALHGDDPRARFTADEAELETADFVVASGVLNVRLDIGEDRWRAYVLATVDRLSALAHRGFAFNALSAHSDPEHMRDDLHYADPAALLDHCLRHHGRDASLAHDYELYEFTIRVRTDGRPPVSHNDRRQS